MPHSADPVRDVKKIDGVTVVALRGELDLNRAPELREALSRVIAERPPRLVVDFGDVKYLDSTGLGTLVYFLKEVSGYKGKMALAGVNGMVHNVLEITRLNKVFTVFGSVQEAASALGGERVKAR